VPIAWRPGGSGDFSAKATLNFLLRPEHSIVSTWLWSFTTFTLSFGPDDKGQRSVNMLGLRPPGALRGPGDFLVAGLAS